jgi:hypothetical protein
MKRMQRAGSLLATAVNVQFSAFRMANQFLRAISAAPRIPHLQIAPVIVHLRVSPCFVAKSLQPVAKHPGGHAQRQRRR